MIFRSERLQLSGGDHASGLPFYSLSNIRLKLAVKLTPLHHDSPPAFLLSLHHIKLHLLRIH